MKKILAVLAAIVVLAAPWSPIRSAEIESAVIATTNADTAGVALRVPRGNQTIVIRNISLWYDNAANTNPAYAGIVAASAAQTRILWFGDAMASSGITALTYGPMYIKLTKAQATAGLRLFISAASSDSLQGIVEYEVVND